MSEQPKREVVTIDGVQVTLNLAESPVKNLGVTTGAELFQLVNILDPKYQPENYNKADGTPLRLFESAAVKIDLSKRSREDMGFWHRNVDYHEVIICFRGALRWETEIKTVTLRAGEIMIIPKGITHRSMLCEESEAENILIELKVTDALAYVGEKK
jgi:mannose-6-phosphate isomerase-like protein (cupin superfamily)